MDQIIATLPKRPDRASVSQAMLGRQVWASSTEITCEPSRLYYFVKRASDIVLSFFGILFLIPLFLVVALCIKLDDGGPILHFREIIGMHGRHFYALKFRSMIPNADEYLAQRPALLRK